MKKKMTNEEYEEYRVKVFKYIEELDKEIRRLRKEIKCLNIEKQDLEYLIKILNEECAKFTQMNTGKGEYYDTLVEPVKIRNEINNCLQFINKSYLKDYDLSEYKEKIKVLEERLVYAEAEGHELIKKEGEVSSKLRSAKENLVTCKTKIKEKELNLSKTLTEKQKYMGKIKKADKANNNDKAINPRLLLQPKKN